MNIDQLRQEFPVTEQWAFLDHAAVAPLPQRSRDAIHEWASSLCDHGVAGARLWLKRLKEVREMMARLLNGEADEIAFVKNTTEGVGFVAEGYPWQAGDNVVTAAEEYPTNVYPWMNLQSKGVEVRLVKSRGSRIEMDDLVAQLDDRTRLVSLSFVEFASGFRNDLDKIGGLCRERGIHFFVDAIQGLGALPLDVKKTPIDFLSADSHKWMLGPEGAGVFWIRKELIDFLRPIEVGWNSVVDAWNFDELKFDLKPSADRWEGGTWNAAGIHAMGRSVELLLELGLEQVAARIQHLTECLCEQASNVGLQVFSSREESEWSGIVSLIVPGSDPRDLMKRCREQGIIVNNRGGRLRISPHCYNTEEEIDRLIEALRPFRTHPVT